MLLSDEAESVIFMVLIAGHVRNGYVLVVVKILVDGEVVVIPLSDLQKRRDFELA